jgi:hypothetical protein
MHKLQHQWVTFLASLVALFALNTFPVFAGQTTITPGVNWDGGSTGFGANIATSLVSFGPASLRASAALLTGPHSTNFGLGADVVGSQGGFFYGAGANVLFPTCSGCSTSFDPDILAGAHLVGNLALEARYYISTRSDTNGIFFAGLQFALP